MHAALMRAAVMRGFGATSQVSPGELPKPQCRPDDLLVRVIAAGVNPTDWKEIEGNLTSFYPPYAPEWAPGFDAAGIVERVGERVHDFAPGDRVMLLSDRREGQCGTFAEYVRVDRKLAAKAPSSIGLAQAASIPIAGLTAYQGLFREDMGALKKGQSLLIQGGSGGIGSFAIGFAKAAGAAVAATCREVNGAYLRSLGADATSDYTQGDTLGAVRRWAPGGVDLVLDAATGGTQPELLDALAPGGRMVVVATVTHDGDIAALHKRAEREQRSVHFLLLDIATVAADLAAIARVIDGAKMRLPAITRYPLDRARDALASMQAGGVRGKLVIDVGDRG